MRSIAVKSKEPTPLKNSQTATGEYYDGKIETIDYLEFLMDALTRNGIPASRAYNVVAAVKYLSPRLGAKVDQPIELDLMKAENYIHRARTGKWLDKESLIPYRVCAWNGVVKEEQE
jgi:hypothetical protein